MAKRKIYKFRGTEGAGIPLSDAQKWIQLHQDHHAAKAHFYGKEILQKLLDQPGAMGIRIYHAINDSNEKILVLVAADEKGKDLWGAKPSTGKFKAQDDPVGAVDQGKICPPWCAG